MCEGGSRESSQEIVVGVQHVFVCIFERYFEDRVTWTGGTMDEGQRARQGVGLSSGGGWWRHLVRKGRVWEEQVLGASSHPEMSLRVYVTSKWMPLRGSCTNGLKAYEQGQGWK